MEPFNAPGIAALSHEESLIETGGVVASVTREVLQELVKAYRYVENRKLTRDHHIIAAPYSNGQWYAVGWIRESRTYSLNLRGVSWQVPEAEMAEFIANKALPFLARGTTDKLLTKSGIKN